MSNWDLCEGESYSLTEEGSCLDKNHRWVRKKYCYHVGAFVAVCVHSRTSLSLRFIEVLAGPQGGSPNQRPCHRSHDGFMSLTLDFTSSLLCSSDGWDNSLQ